MKYILIVFFLLFTGRNFAQSAFPEFLQGTWKIENQNIFEHWDKLNEKNLKGFSYRIKDGQIIISEYLDIYNSKNEMILTATVLNQNQGEPVNFKLTKNDSTFTFENLHHDFPKRIVYQKLNEEEMLVQVSDGKHKSFSYKMRRILNTVVESYTNISNPNYNKVLANKLNADDYGMKSYILVILKTGTNQTKDTTLINSSFRGHISNITRLVKEGIMIVAGPLGGNDKNYRGIFILNLESIKEADELLKTDPAIKEDLLTIELYNWYGSAALIEYLPAADKVWKIKP